MSFGGHVQQMIVSLKNNRELIKKKPRFRQEKKFTKAAYRKARIAMKPMNEQERQTFKIKMRRRKRLMLIRDLVVVGVAVVILVAVFSWLWPHL